MNKPNPAAALWLATIALIVMAAMSAAIHEAAKVAPVGQLVFWRSFVALIPIVIYMGIRGQLGASVRGSGLGVSPCAVIVKAAPNAIIAATVM